MLLKQICQLARASGEAIMAVYNANQPTEAYFKQDASPVTVADLVAHNIICTGLAQISPEIPILSEEDPQPWSERQTWNSYWLVDPLDGTKEFLHRNGEFTVNIALIEQGQPVLGVVYAPALDLLYCAADGRAWKVAQSKQTQIQVRDDTPATIVVSRSHYDAELTDYLEKIGDHQTIPTGSSLKFCLVAEGHAQQYPRFGPTYIWDTAAGHAIAIASGAEVYDWKGKILDYQPRESLLNPGFCVKLRTE